MGSKGDKEPDSCTDLKYVLRHLEPQLDPEVYVFVSLPGADWSDAAPLDPVAGCREAGGLSLVVSEAAARAKNLPFSGTFRRITLGACTGLEDVGLTAALTTALAQQTISANVVAGACHDHLFVPSWCSDRALAVIGALGR